MKKRVVAMVLAATMAVGLLTGCGGTKTPETKPAETTEADAKEETEKAEDTVDDGQVYTLNFGHTLTEKDPFHQA